MWPDRVSNPGPLTYESGALPIALRGPARYVNEQIFVQIRACLSKLWTEISVEPSQNDHFRYRKSYTSGHLNYEIYETSVRRVS